MKKNDNTIARHLNTQWPKLTNCHRNCKNCFAKCIYRKEPNEAQDKHDENITSEIVCK